MQINVLNKETFKIELKNLDVNFQNVVSPLLIPNPLTLCINGEDNGRFNFFNTKTLTFESFNNQLKEFNKNNKINVMYLHNVTNFIDYYDDVIVPFCRKNNIKIVVRAGFDLMDMGICDITYHKTPIQILEEYGVLDLEPIILSATRLEKEDLEKLSYYNASVCLDLSNDLISGSGVAQIPTMQNLNLNIMLNVRNDLFEELKLVYMLSNGIYNHEQSYANILKMALINGYKAFNLNNKQLMLLSRVNSFELKHLVLNLNKNNIVTNSDL